MQLMCTHTHTARIHATPAQVTTGDKILPNGCSWTKYKIIKTTMPCNGSASVCMSSCCGRPPLATSYLHWKYVQAGVQHNETDGNLANCDFN
eukprot:2166876-Amphidinium_carterae.1